MREYVLRNRTFAKEKPAICIPIVGEDDQDILAQARMIRDYPCDLAEWRADWYQEVGDRKALAGILNQLRDCLGDLPLLFTFRTAAEGGKREISWPDYRELLTETAGLRLVDLIDVEAFFDKDGSRSLIDDLHRLDCPVIASYHDFSATPDNEDMFDRLQKMEKMDADILKLAVMPSDRRDVLRLMDVTLKASALLSRPLVTMSMGKEGLISRMSGEIFGSSITFGCAGRASAPGQIDAYDLEKILNLMHQG